MMVYRPFLSQWILSERAQDENSQRELRPGFEISNRVHRNHIRFHPPINHYKVHRTERTVVQNLPGYRVPRGGGGRRPRRRRGAPP